MSGVPSPLTSTQSVLATVHGVRNIDDGFVISRVVLSACSIASCAAAKASLRCWKFPTICRLLVPRLNVVMASKVSNTSMTMTRIIVMPRWQLRRPLMAPASAPKRC